MPKIIEQWLLFKYIDGEFTPLSKPLRTKLAEKAREISGARVEDDWG
jgi:hypothetical protein